MTPEPSGGPIALQSPSITTYDVEIRVRYAECDPMGVVHHSNYWAYFEYARTEMLRANGVRYRDLEAAGVLFVVYRCACTYKLPIRYDDLVIVRTTIERMTRTRIDHAYKILRGSDLCCEATTVLACVDRSGHPILMPDHLWPGQPERGASVH
jgi:acyl-CoA thioester hydrolase